MGIGEFWILGFMLTNIGLTLQVYRTRKQWGFINILLMSLLWPVFLLLLILAVCGDLFDLIIRLIRNQ